MAFFNLPNFHSRNGAEENRKVRMHGSENIFGQHEMEIARPHSEAVADECRLIDITERRYKRCSTEEGGPKIDKARRMIRKRRA